MDFLQTIIGFIQKIFSGIGSMFSGLFGGGTPAPQTPIAPPATGSTTPSGDGPSRSSPARSRQTPLPDLDDMETDRQIGLRQPTDNPAIKELFTGGIFNELEVKTATAQDPIGTQLLEANAADRDDYWDLGPAMVSRDTQLHSASRDIARHLTNYDKVLDGARDSYQHIQGRVDSAFDRIRALEKDGVISKDEADRLMDKYESAEIRQGGLSEETQRKWDNMTNMLDSLANKGDVGEEFKLARQRFGMTTQEVLDGMREKPPSARAIAAAEGMFHAAQHGALDEITPERAKEFESTLKAVKSEMRPVFEDVEDRTFVRKIERSADRLDDLDDDLKELEQRRDKEKSSDTPIPESVKAQAQQAAQGASFSPPAPAPSAPTPITLDGQGMPTDQLPDGRTTPSGGITR